ncbi:putative Co/Zn/Cd efflux system membrane fusion protein [Labilithrix luteola]|uniref:Putative Co/Zn/Cd efflux system membrane fusion protein n=2 Tax=Labilithrix luteola TaxID=1391654 RepID=A0A0K1PYT2_9BACT|nr:putative Co/Zn/Cd efflux system membrane fusion protein [Labilithrix luteola]
MYRIPMPLVLVAALATTGCHRENHVTEEEGKFLATRPVRKDTELTKEYVAQIRAIQHIELRALEKGYLQKVFVDEGQHIAAGTKMFQIMPLIYQAEVQKAQAEADLSEIELKNTKLLADKNVVSPNELSLSNAKFNKAKAEVALASTHKSLTEIRAPFDGIMGRFNVRLGSLVAEGDLLTTLSDNRNIWVYFNVSEAEYLKYKQQQNQGSEPTPVKLIMANGEVFDQPGKVETIEADFNNGTGNLAFRATFPNPKGLLRHGETGKVVMTTPVKNALVIPQKATFDVLDKKFVYVIDEKNVVRQRPITVVAELPHVFLVDSGLDEKDKVLVDGLRKVHDGSPVAIDFKEPAEVLGHLDVAAE